MCYVLSVIQLLRMNGFFLSVMDFFLCVMVYTVQWFLYKLLVNDIVIIIIMNYELHECLDLETI